MLFSGTDFNITDPDAISTFLPIVKYGSINMPVPILTQSPTVTIPEDIQPGPVEQLLPTTQ